MKIHKISNGRHCDVEVSDLVLLGGPIVSIDGEDCWLVEVSLDMRGSNGTKYVAVSREVARTQRQATIAAMRCVIG